MEFKFNRLIQFDFENFTKTLAKSFRLLKSN